MAILTVSACALCTQPIHPGHCWALPDGALVHIVCGIHSRGITKDPDAFIAEPALEPRQEREHAQKAHGRAQQLIDDARGLRRARGRVGTATAVLLLLGTVAAEPAWADPMFFVRAFDGARVGPDIQAHDSGQVQIIPATVGEIIITRTFFSAMGPDLGSGSAAAALGSLTAFAEASSSGDGIAVRGNGEGEWLDTVVATSSIPGTKLGTFRATIALSDGIRASANVEGSATEALSLFDATHGVGSGPLIALHDAPDHPLIDRTATVTITEPVGVPFKLVGDLVVSAAAGDLFGMAEGFIDVDARHTATFNLDPITPGVGYTTASGVSYLSSATAAVPEPATFTLLSVGALGLLSGRRRWLRRGRTPSGAERVG
jgi:hypothetical protein